MLFLISSILSCTGDANQKKEMEYKDEKFEVGQVWKYQAREGEAESTLQILKIEKFADQESFIHVSVKGLHVKNPNGETGVSETIQHLPFARKAIAKSVTELVSSKTEIADFEEGYETWKKAYDAGEGGVFSISVAEAVAFVEKTLN